MTTEFQSKSKAGSIELGRGFHGVVELDLEYDLVRKTLSRLETDEAERFIQREFEHLQRLSSALFPYTYLSCPEPVSVEPEDATLWMTYCPGDRLDKFLADPRDTGTHLEHIARQIAYAIQVYVEEFREPFFSLGTHNMVYEADSGVLSLFDFTMPRTFDGVDVGQFPYEVTLGCFLSATTRYTARARGCTHRNYWHRQRHLSIAVTQHLLNEHQLQLPVIEQVNAEMYERLGRKDKRVSRRLWYSTVGLILFRMRSREIFSACKVGNDKASSDAI